MDHLIPGLFKMWGKKIGKVGCLHLYRQTRNALSNPFALAWAVALGTVSEILGFTAEMGALLAGFSLASTEYRDAIAGRLTAIRDFLLLFFFVALAARIEWAGTFLQFGPAAVLSLFVLVDNPLIVMAIMGFMGYRRRTSFLAGLTVAQISKKP